MSDKKYVYSFAPGSVEGNRDMRDTLGGKGANLAEMAGIGIPVYVSYNLLVHSIILPLLFS